MLPTPDTGHVPFERIYEPSEDSFLLLDTLSSEAEKGFLRARFGSSDGSHKSHPIPSPIVLEIGTGSGVILAFINAHAGIIFGRDDIVTLGIDINSHACQATQQTVQIAADEKRIEGGVPGLYVGNVVGDLTSSLRCGLVDLLIFNPPYVPTPEMPATPAFENEERITTYEEDSNFLALSYAGGRDGMETTNRLLAVLPETLSDSGIAYVLLAAQNQPEAVKKETRAWGSGWKVETVASSGKKAGWEKLQIIKISRH